MRLSTSSVDALLIKHYLSKFKCFEYDLKV